MGTPFADVYSIFLRLIEDYELAEMIESDFNASLRFYLDEARHVHFIESATDLNAVDEANMCFVNKLKPLEVHILAHAMLLPWMSARINTLTNLRLKMSTQDFKASSAQAHLSTLIEYKRDVIRDLRDFIQKYEYSGFQGF